MDKAKSETVVILCDVSGVGLMANASRKESTLFYYIDNLVVNIVSNKQYHQK